MKIHEFIFESDDVEEGKTGPGLWRNIHDKQERIKHGSGERMRKPGSKGAPTAKNFKDAQGGAKNESMTEDRYDESNMMYRYDPADGKLYQRMVHNLDERQARSEGYKETPERALKAYGIIRSKYDPKKFVQKIGDKWVQVFPYGKPKVTEMDSEGHRGHRGDEDPGKGPEKVVKPVKTKDVAKDAEKELEKAMDKAHQPSKKGVAEAAKWRHDDLEGKTWRSADWDDGDLSSRKIQIDRHGKDVDDYGDELKARPGMWGGKYKRMTKKGTPTQHELGMQNITKRHMKFDKKKGGLSGPKGPLPEEQGVAEGAALSAMRSRHIAGALDRLMRDRSSLGEGTEGEIDKDATQTYAIKIIRSLAEWCGENKFNWRQNDDGSVTIYKQPKARWAEDEYRQYGKQQGIDSSYLNNSGILTGKNFNASISPFYKMFRQKDWRFDQPVGGEFTIAVTKEQGVTEGSKKK